MGNGQKNISRYCPFNGYTVGTKYTLPCVYESVLLCVSTEWTVIGRARKRRHTNYTHKPNQTALKYISKEAFPPSPPLTLSIF